ncbi:hypothetical protein, conserved [Leishmania tarentolae]|uniref:Uncharacterized protein n=1 Tax=Leishmania tarentolae TaxID=5689 RepID=A0A640KZB7_LEITA|nr:hypothetical protein, conserved [Leishmania tarentolae]
MHASICASSLHLRSFGAGSLFLSGLRALFLRQRKSRHHVMHNLIRYELVAVGAGHCTLLPVRRRELRAHEGAVGLPPHDRVRWVLLIPSAKSLRRCQIPVEGWHVVGNSKIQNAREELLVLCCVVLRQLHELVLQKLQAVRLVCPAYHPRLLKFVAVHGTPSHRLQVPHAAVEWNPAVHTMITVDDRHLIQFHEVAGHRHWTTLVTTISTERIQLVPQ